MQWPTHRQLRTFLAAVETGSVTAAARALNLTQPAASQQLRELERAVGLRLLERAGGRTIPTAAGEALLGPAARAKAAVEDLISTAASLQAGETGKVRLGTGATACIYLLPDLLATIRRRMPRLEVTIATGNSVQICQQVEAGLLDVGLVTLPMRAHRALSVTTVREDPMVAIFPETLVPQAQAVSPETLASLPLILYEPEGSTRAIVDEWFRSAGLLATPTMELGSVEAIKVLVAQGLGASIIPGLAAGAPTTGTQVRTLMPTLTRRLGVVLRREKVMDRGSRLLVDTLVGAGGLNPVAAQTPGLRSS